MTEPKPEPVPHRLLIRDLVLEAEIGVHDHEHGRAQRVRLNLDLWVDPPPEPMSDDIQQVVSYSRFVAMARALVGEGHVNLVETLAERLAARCLAHRRVQRVRVRVEKLDVYPDVGAVGVEVERSRPRSGRP